MSADERTRGPGASLATQQQAWVIYDRGYRRYDGPRLGRLQIVRALFWHSFRSAFGIGRGPKAKIVPVIVFVGMCLPAVVNAVAVARGGPPVVYYGTYTFPLRVVVMTIFVAVQAPELVSRDLRSHVLPLYFSRPLRRGDYPAGEVRRVHPGLPAHDRDAAARCCTWATSSSAAGGSAVWHQTRVLAGGLARRGAVGGAAGRDRPRAGMPEREACLRDGRVAIFFFLTWTLAQIIYSVAGHPVVVHAPCRASAPARHGRCTAVTTSGQQLAGLISPFTVLDGVRQWLGGKVPGPMAPPGHYGPAYGVMFLVLLAASLAILAIRYRKAGVE